MKTICKLMATLAMVVTFADTSHAETRTLSGPGVTDDNVIYAYPTLHTNNYGSADSGAVGVGAGVLTRSLLRFDLSSVSGLAGKTVTNASLTLTVKGAYHSFANQTVSLYPIFAYNVGWVEGTANGVYQHGSSDWEFSADNGDYTSIQWRAVPFGVVYAGLGNPGDAYTNVPAATFLASSTDTNTPGTTVTINFADLSFLQNWINNPSQNAGFLIRAPGMESVALDAFWIWYSSEASNPAFQPVLTVDFIPEPSVMCLFAAGALLVWRRTCRRQPTES